MKKILFIAPLPPPITGQSLATDVLLQGLKNDFEIEVINYSRENAVSKSKFNFKLIKRFLQFGKIIKNKSKSVDFVYFTISQSILGNLKDIYFLFKLGKNNRMKTMIHLHGGFFDSLYKRMPLIIKILNKIYFKEIMKGIVLGESLKKCLLPIIDEKKIIIIPNFYKNNLKITKQELINKWQNIKEINVIFLSNLMEEKGYNELLEGYFLLPDIYKNNIKLFFAGEFELNEKKELFLNKISEYYNIKYLGVINGKEKIELLKKSHVFFLPTYYKFEGQPISILESYASGLVVFTTDHAGIKDIFHNNINGEIIESKSSKSIKEKIIKIIENINFYKNLGYNNWEYSDNYTEEKFINSIKDIFK